jgi:DNA-binding transcriptional LysR family regulator
MSKSNKYIPKLDTDLISLRALVAIADEGSFSAAAERIDRTQSAVSLQISKLENRVEAKLFERTSRKVTTTEVGEKFVAYARRILDLADEAMMSISAPDSHELFRIGFADYLVPKHLHTLLAQFTRAHPNVDLKLNLGLGIDLHKELENGDLDIVVAGPEFEGGQILFHEPLVWVGSKAYKPDETVSLILMPPPCSYRQAAYDCLTAENFRFRVTMQANSIQGIQSAVAAGLGVSVVARSAVTEDIRILDNIYPELPNTSIVAYVRPGASQILADRFLAFLIEGLASHGIG